MTWILLLTIITGYGTGVTSVQMDTQEACVRAKAGFKSTSIFREIETQCLNPRTGELK